MKRQRVTFPWNLYWENKTNRLKRSTIPNPGTGPEILDYEFSCSKTKLALGLTQHKKTRFTPT